MFEDQFCNDPTCDRVREGEQHLKHDLSRAIEKRSKSLADLISDGFRFAGVTTGAGLGFVFGGPAGAIVGAGLGTSIELIGDEIGKRFLAKRERERVGYIIIRACDKIKQNMDNGMKLRPDDFFDDNQGDRSAAKEIVEGILIAAQKEYQEKKLPFYSNLLANIAFHPEIDRGQANLLIRSAERLSYRQLCILSLVSQKSRFNLRQQEYRTVSTIEGPLAMLLIEVFDLISQLMLNIPGVAVLGVAEIDPSKLNAQGTGSFLFDLMELRDIDYNELKEIALILS